MPLIEKKLQLVVNKIFWLDETQGFRFSVSKTVVMHFCRLHGVHPDPDLQLNNRRISSVEETRFRGLTFEGRLTWEPHLRYNKMACTKVLSLLRGLVQILGELTY